MKKTILPESLSTSELHQYLLGSVAPRPIAFVSTLDEEGRDNLAPYSFFNAFSSNPPILVFSSNRRVESNTTKDTLHNIQISRECVINVVNYEIVRQMMVCSVDFPKDISEFEQTGLTPEPASLVKAPLVKESPVNLECKVTDILTLGDKGGAGHLIICEVVALHISEQILDENQRIDPHKIDLMGRMGRAFYVRASGANVMALPQSQQLPIVGYPNLPEHVRTSRILTANVIGAMAGMKALPSREEAQRFVAEHEALRNSITQSAEEKQVLAQEFFNKNQLDLCVALLMSI
ncbi:MAG TPA: flavin reductase family protein [Saprospiraceae bacterium]|nr:flavin reductase family protein [Saprospiraceae bacterium]